MPVTPPQTLANPPLTHAYKTNMIRSCIAGRIPEMHAPPKSRDEQRLVRPWAPHVDGPAIESADAGQRRCFSATSRSTSSFSCCLRTLASPEGLRPIGLQCCGIQSGLGFSGFPSRESMSTHADVLPRKQSPCRGSASREARCASVNPAKRLRRIFSASFRAAPRGLPASLPFRQAGTDKKLSSTPAARAALFQPARDT